MDFVVFHCLPVSEANSWQDFTAIFHNKTNVCYKNIGLVNLAMLASTKAHEEVNKAIRNVLFCPPKNVLFATNFFVRLTALLEKNWR